MRKNTKQRKPRRVDCDDEGWSYAMEPTHFLLNPEETVFDNPGSNAVIRPVRRRKWTRQRALVEYPHASESTKCFLRLMSQNLFATMMANKVSEQLVQTKCALTEAESLQMQCKDEIVLKVRELKWALETKGKLTPRNAKSTIQAAIAVADQMQAELLSLLSVSVRDKLASSTP